MRVFHELSRRAGLHGESHPVRRTTSDKALLVGRHVDATVRRNPFLARGPFDALVVPHPRKVRGVEIYTDRLRSRLGPSALVLDSGINGVPLPGSRNLDFFTSAAGALPSRSVDERCGRISAELAARTGVEVPVGRIVARELPKHTRLRRLYRSLLARQQITTAYVVVAYFHQHIVGAARDLGIRVVELQHGAMSPFHLAYSYPGRPDVADQPDELWCLGPYWPRSVELPAGMRSDVIGAPFLSPLSAEHRAAKDPRRVVFASQGTIGRRLIGVALDLAERRPDLDIVFRLHPSEHQSDYRDAEGRGVRVSGGPSEQTSQLLASAGFQVGVATTALFEGMVLGCRTAVVTLPGWEYLRPAAERGDALVVHNGEELARRLDSAPLCRDSSDYYAPDRLDAVLA